MQDVEKDIHKWVRCGRNGRSCTVHDCSYKWRENIVMLVETCSAKSLYHAAAAKAVKNFRVRQP